MSIIDPLLLAFAHQKNMADLVEKIRADAGCIRQLMVGRLVLRKSDRVEFKVKEVRLGLSHVVLLYGKRSTARKTEGNIRLTRIGTVYDIEIVRE